MLEIKMPNRSKRRFFIDEITIHRYPRVPPVRSYIALMRSNFAQNNDGGKTKISQTNFKMFPYGRKYSPNLHCNELLLTSLC